MPEEPFLEIPSYIVPTPNVFRFECPKCEFVHERRRDSFLPGAHVIICKNFEGRCGYSTTAVELIGGERREVTAESHQGGGA